MAVLDFPNPPLTVGQQFLAGSGITYSWDGAVWTIAATPTGASGPAGGDLAGSYPNPTIGALKVVTAALADLAVTDAKIADVSWAKITGAPAVPAALWTDDGTALTPAVPTRSLSVPGGAAGAGSALLSLGSNVAKARLQTDNAATAPWLAMSVNRDAMTGTVDDATKPAWNMTM